MRRPMSLPSRYLSGLIVALAVLMVAACSSGDAASADSGPAARSSSNVKMHVVLGAGPFKGTYDVATDLCLANALGPGSWNATWEADHSLKDKITGVLVTNHPTSRIVSARTTAVVGFGGDGDDKILYEVMQSEPTITDRGATATLVFKGKARVAFYRDGSFADGGDTTITVECGEIQRH